MRCAMFFYLAAAIGTAYCQQFEVASVKPSKAAESISEGQVRAQDMMHEIMPPGQIPMKGATVSAHGRTLAQLIAMAHKIKPSLVKGPGWIHELRYDVDAKLPEGASSKDANAMLQNLLTERFGLKTHAETKATSGYALLVGKDGPKLQPAVESTTPVDKEAMQRQMQERARKRMEEMKKAGGGMRRSSSWASNSATSAQIADAVSRMIKAPVVDETGLTGKYDVNIEIVIVEPDETDEYRMSVALAKLGLKLESKKADVTSLLVDSASRTPTEN